MKNYQLISIIFKVLTLMKFKGLKRDKENLKDWLKPYVID